MLRSLFYRLALGAAVIALAGCGGPSLARQSVASASPANGSPATDPNGDALAGGATFALRSPAVAADGLLPQEYTCDGASATPPLAWEGAPAAATSFAVVMHHVPGPGDTHWYWVLYDIPADVRSLPENVAGVGTLGNNSVNGRAAYAPPCSKGPGPKTYTFTVYALSAPPQLDVPPSAVSRDVLLAAIADRTLATGTLNVVYSR